MLCGLDTIGSVQAWGARGCHAIPQGGMSQPPWATQCVPATHVHMGATEVLHTFCVAGAGAKGAGLQARPSYCCCTTTQCRGCTGQHGASMPWQSKGRQWPTPCWVVVPTNNVLLVWFIERPQMCNSWIYKLMLPGIPRGDNDLGWQAFCGTLGSSSEPLKAEIQKQKIFGITRKCAS